MKATGWYSSPPRSAPKCRRFSSPAISLSVPAGSITGGAIKDPLNGNTPFPGNIIPTARLSPIVAKLQQYYPATNLPGFSSNFSVPVPTTISTNQTVDRIDQNIGDKIRLYVRAHYQNENVFGGSAVPVNATTIPVTTSNYTVGYTHTLTPNLVNDFRVGRHRLDTDDIELLHRERPEERRDEPGNHGLSPETRSTTTPAFRNSTSRASTDWATRERTGTRPTARISFPNRLVGSHGSHNIVAGAEFRRLATAREATNSPRGAFTFNGTLTGYAPADFILGRSAIVLHARAGSARPRGRMARWFLRAGQMAGLAQTHAELRAALRAADRGLHGKRQRHRAQCHQTAIVGGTPGFHFTNPQHSDWAPRLGFAYRIDDKTVFRGGGGIYYNPNQTNSYTFLSNNPPFATILNCTWSAGLTPVSLNSPVRFRGGLSAPSPTAGTIATDPWNQPTARMNQWSASLERQLWSGGGLELRISRLAFLPPGPQLLQQHASPRARLRQHAPAEPAVRRDPHHRYRRNRQLRGPERCLPPAHEPRLADAGQLHLVAYAGRQHATPTAAALR